MVRSVIWRGRGEQKEGAFFTGLAVCSVQRGSKARWEAELVVPNFSIWVMDMLQWEM